ncbi:hypothetical protein KY289_003414 [Solanum tuberosum]|nr:hypothetical protein KY289_003414 [Solanum tuberosum]
MVYKNNREHNKIRKDQEHCPRLLTGSSRVFSYFPTNDCLQVHQIIQDVEAISLATNEHPVALLAEHTKKPLQRDNTIYMRILSQRPNAAAVSASILHKLYGIKLCKGKQM